MMRILTFVLAFLSVPVAAQTQHNIFPDETGKDLLQLLLDAYKPTTLLSEAATKDVMMDEIYRANDGSTDGVYCVYTEYFVEFDGQPSSDPNQDIFNNGAGLNQEHLWPRSQLGGSGEVPSERDMHHLVPTRVDVNGDRASFPFAQIPDPETTRWYWLDQQQSTIPDGSIIDEFSELKANTSFEPREDFKGNVARAMFYIATMYPDEANMAFFTPAQQSTLYDWHYADPVDQIEYDRTFLIAGHQSDDPNPFVLDSTLIRRAFFPEIVVNVPMEQAGGTLDAEIYPNPFIETSTLDISIPNNSWIRVEVFDALGRRLSSILETSVATGTRIQLPIHGKDYAPGIYLIRITTENQRLTRRLVKTG
ncbi:MAG: endonuclease [Rubricoccaceae bacterium]|nr:endonuclease [Rubricoccaceae bacterium]